MGAVLSMVPAIVWRRGCRRLEVPQDGALGTVVSGTGPGQILERFCHLLQMRDLLAKVAHPRLRQRLHIGAAPAGVAPQIQKIRDLRYREAQIPRPGDEPEHVDVGISIVAIAGGGAPCRRDQADLLVIADHLRRYARAGRSISDVHGLSSIMSLERIWCFPSWEGQERRQDFPDA